MAVTLPTAADVRKVREQAAKNAAERAEFATKPLLAVLGAGDRAVAGVAKFATAARTRAEKQADVVQQRVLDLPAEFDGLRAKLNADEVRKVVEAVREQATAYYADLAGRGEVTWGRIRKQPQVEQALTVIGEYGEKLDSRVDDLVDDAHDAAEKALSTVTRQTRSVGEKVARTTDDVAETAAETVAEVTAEAGKAVADAGEDLAETVAEVGGETAATTRSAARRSAEKTAPKAPRATTPRGTTKAVAKTEPKTVATTVEPQTAARKPATRRGPSA
ncbi:hypothetical protein [Pseudonocardia sp.]|uniref:hypothetical protein n=1 Tax=Pseudonocardia sp. TaxID=60912 RepID=UPI003D147532